MLGIAVVENGDHLATPHPRRGPGGSAVVPRYVDLHAAFWHKRRSAHALHRPGQRTLVLHARVGCGSKTGSRVRRRVTVWGNRSLNLGRDHGVFNAAVISCSYALKERGRV